MSSMTNVPDQYVDRNGKLIALTTTRPLPAKCRAPHTTQETLDDKKSAAATRCRTSKTGAETDTLLLNTLGQLRQASAPMSTQ